LRGIAIRALRIVRDTLWIGTDAGLMVLDTRTRASSPQRARVTAEEPRLTRPVYALAQSDSMLVVALDDGIVGLSLPSRALMPRLSTVATAAVGRIAAMDADADGILLAGSAGAMLVDRVTGATQLLSAPRDIPAEGLDVLLEREWAWIATPAGVVRLRRVGGRTQ
jgi:ligand-binding sensor domain-containing protein